MNLNATDKLTELKWGTVPISEVLSTNMRLDASVYDEAGKNARSTVANLPWELKPLNGSNGIAHVSHRPRFKRIFMNYSRMPIFQPSQIRDIKPRPLLYVSDKTNTNLESLRVKKGQILLTCSGTVGISTLVSESYDQKIFSHDLLRVEPKDLVDSGYVYAFLNTETGNTLITTNNYGAVIQHIEPEHLEDLMVPFPPKELRKQISNLVLKSFDLRDQSNRMIDQATAILVDSLKLPPLRKLLKSNLGVDAHSVSSDNLQGRFEATYHHTKVDIIHSHLAVNAVKVAKIGDKTISKNITLPGRFKRIYVSPKRGIVFFGGKQIFELNPSGKKYLSMTHHEDRIKEQLTLRNNMVLVTCSGTIGRVQLTPKHWDGWAANQHILRIVPSGNDLAGYLYIWLQSEYGEVLIKRNKYGAVVDELDSHQMANVAVPIIEEAVMGKINALALEANDLRYRAYTIEQEAIEMFNVDILKLPPKP